MSIIDDTILYTIPIVSFDKNKKIEKMFSGCLVNFRNLVFILSVAHGIKNKKSKVAIVVHNIYGMENIPNWYIFNPTRLKEYRTKYKTKLASMIFKINKKIFKKLNDDELMSKIIKYVGGIDFMSSIVHLPFLPIHSLPVNSILCGKNKKIFKENQLSIPQDNKEYCFFGLTNPKFIENNYYCDETFVDGVSYIRTEGFYHLFKMDKNRNNLKGCSGSPIIDSDNKLVSLVVKRHKTKRNYFYGIDLSKTKIALHQEVNSLTGEEIYE